MRVAFFQAALLAVATRAAEANDAQKSVEAPDFLAQTAALVDYLMPSLNIEETLNLAEVEVEAEAGSDVETVLNADIMGEIRAKCGSDADCIKAETEKRTRVMLDDKSNQNQLKIDTPVDKTNKIQYNKDATFTMDNTGGQCDPCKPKVSAPKACPPKKCDVCAGLS